MKPFVFLLLLGSAICSGAPQPSMLKELDSLRAASCQEVVPDDISEAWISDICTDRWVAASLQKESTKEWETYFVRAIQSLVRSAKAQNLAYSDLNHCIAAISKALKADHRAFVPIGAICCTRKNGKHVWVIPGYWELLGVSKEGKPFYLCIAHIRAYAVDPETNEILGVFTCC